MAYAAASVPASRVDSLRPRGAAGDLAGRTERHGRSRNARTFDSILAESLVPQREARPDSTDSRDRPAGGSPSARPARPEKPAGRDRPDHSTDKADLMDGPAEGPAPSDDRTPGGSTEPTALPPGPATETGQAPATDPGAKTDEAGRISSPNADAAAVAGMRLIQPPTGVQALFPADAAPPSGAADASAAVAEASPAHNAALSQAAMLAVAAPPNAAPDPKPKGGAGPLMPGKPPASQPGSVPAASTARAGEPSAPADPSAADPQSESSPQAARHASPKGNAPAAGGVFLDTALAKQTVEAPPNGSAPHGDPGGAVGRLEAWMPQVAPAATQDAAATRASVASPPAPLFTPTDAGPAYNADRLATVVHAAAARGQSVARMTLEPPDLGQVTAVLRMRHDHADLRLEVASEAAKDLLNNHLERLRESLQQQGISLDRATVHVAPRSESSGGRDQPAGQGTQGHQQPQHGFQPDGGAPDQDRYTSFGSGVPASLLAADGESLSPVLMQAMGLDVLA